MLDSRTHGVRMLGVTLVLGALSASAAACPFCGVVGESLAARRDRADVVAIGEPTTGVRPDAVGLPEQSFVVRQVLRTAGAAAADPSVVARVPEPIGGLAVLFAGAGEWTAVAADELLIAHVATAPAVEDPAARRLAWFARRLEHPHPAIAEDAFTEFGLAAFAAVREAAPALDAARLRGWLADPAIDPRRRGFYGLALGLVAATSQEVADRDASVAALRASIDAPADDFRAGFDGLLGGLLVVEGAAGLDAIAARGLLDPEARPVDQRHVLAALRFAWEDLGDVIPRERVARATARLLGAAAVAAEAAVDLARYEWWDSLADVEALWDRWGDDDPLLRRAVAGHLAACPLPEGRAALARLRGRDPVRVAEAVAAAFGPGARPQSPPPESPQSPPPE
jgi:hypothetical protein